MPLQKSFSEQNDSFKTRRWQKSKSHSAVGESTTSTSSRRPLQPVSETAKAKLNAFNFQPIIEESKGSDPTKRPVDENEIVSRHGAKPSSLSNDNANAQKPTSLPASLSESRTFSTPVSRLAWQDLIGDSDNRVEVDDASPQDKIGWDTKQQPTYGISPMPRKRGTKRARSSSPMSSPAGGTKRATPAVNVRDLSAALKSPCADPAMELWDRFSLSGPAATTPMGAANPALANILGSSSPQHSRSVGHAEVGLRRAISCGTNWPKRRRVERIEKTSHSTNAAQDGSPVRNTKTSMVNALLKSVTGEINRSKAAQTHRDALRSPSPKKRRHTSGGHLSMSPSKRTSPRRSPPQFPGAVGASKQTKPATAANLSDYEDDDFDDDTLMSLDVSILSQAPRYDTKAPEPEPPKTAPKEDRTTAPQEVNLLDDEFGDLDDDIFAEAGDLLSQIDSTSNSVHHTTRVSPPTTANAQAQKIVAENPADDVFGDDFGGDFDFEAAEMAATQSIANSSGSASRVRAVQQAQGHPTLPRNPGFGKPLYGR
ncbi:hypothetical protein GGS20DRAFT_215845 [Poronia punctata]|nr:hypothetical protein GGS20DRAFT_215845 [Poronia punctata]